MREGAIRLVVMVILVVAAAGLNGKMEGPADTEITVSDSRDWEEIYVFIRSATAQRQSSGEYLVEVEFSTDTPAALTGMRMVTVICGEHRSAFSLTEENQEDVHTVRLMAEDQPETVRVEVRSHDTEAGLLLISDGKGQLCGEAAASVDGDRLLRISGAQPCASFQIYRIADLPELLSGWVVVSSRPTVKERVNYAVSDRYVATIAAEADGTAFVNFTWEGWPDGIYLAVGERESFYICLPQVEASGEFKSSVVRLTLDGDLK